MPARPGDVFTPQAPPYHRYVVLSSPDAEGNVLVANLTSMDEDSDDQGCRLEKADYPPFIKKPTTVRFNKTDLYQAAGIEATPFIKLNEPLPEATLKKIQGCGLRSVHLKKKYRQIIADELGVPLPQI